MISIQRFSIGRRVLSFIPKNVINGESGIRTHGTISHTHALQACPFDRSGISPGVPGRNRTGNLLLRRQLLYPIELRVHK